MRGAVTEVCIQNKFGSPVYPYIPHLWVEYNLIQPVISFHLLVRVIVDIFNIYSDKIYAASNTLLLLMRILFQREFPANFPFSMCLTVIVMEPGGQHSPPNFITITVKNNSSGGSIPRYNYSS